LQDIQSKESHLEEFYSDKTKKWQKKRLKTTIIRKCTFFGVNLELCENNHAHPLLESESVSFYDTIVYRCILKYFGNY